MNKVVRIEPSISYIPAKSDSQNSDSNHFIPIALFSGIGLLVSLVAIVWGVQGAWY